LRRALGRSTRELELMIAHSREAISRGDPLGIAEASTEFHQLLVAATGNELMISFMDQLAPRMIWLFYLTSERDSEQACAEHHELVEVMASGNTSLARSVAHAHIESGRAPSLAAMQL
jgi:DNA-binding GntR family transcriptional regulator